MFNYGGYPPQQPIVFMPPPTTPNTGGFPDIDSISRSIAGLEALKKMLKEEKKEDKKDDKDKKSDTSVVSMMLLMILVSPITGPVMSWFFTQGTSLIHTVPK